jgi:hypothetical protein
MQHLDLSDDEAAALVALLTRTIANDRVIPVTAGSKTFLPSSDPPRPRAPAALEGRCTTEGYRNPAASAWQVRLNIALAASVGNPCFATIRSINCKLGDIRTMFRSTIRAIALSAAISFPITVRSEIYIPDTGSELHRYCTAPADSNLGIVCRTFLATVWNTAGVISGTPSLVSKPFFLSRSETG